METAKIDRLEMDVTEIKQKLNDLYDILAQVNETMKTMNAGLYGDEKNNHPGVIERQREIEKEIVLLKQEIAGIHTKNREQDLALKTKKNYLSLGFEIVKYAALIYLVAKGIFGFDNLFGKFF